MSGQSIVTVPTASPVAQGNPWAGLAAPDFTANVASLPPPGDCFSGSVFADLAGGFGAALGDLHGSAFQLSEVELRPSTTSVCLTDWELDYGLPDTCTPLAATIAQRRAALSAKIAERGGQSRDYYIAVAAALGFAITITEGAPASYTWTVHVAGSFTAIVFRAGGSGAGDFLTSYASNAQLECVLRQIMPAHTILNFAYGS